MVFEVKLVAFVFNGLILFNGRNCESSHNLALSALTGNENLNFQQPLASNSPFFGTQQGYRYLSPASTYKTIPPPTTETRLSQTAPLAISLHSDDYQNFEKEQQTFFIPTMRNTAALEKSSQNKQNFYVHRADYESKRKEFANSASSTDSAKPNWRPINTGSADSLPFAPNLFGELTTAQKGKINLRKQFVEPSVIALNEGMFPANSDKQSVRASEKCTSVSQDNKSNKFSNVQSTINIATYGPKALSTEDISAASEQYSDLNINTTGEEQTRRIQILRALLAEYLSLTFQVARRETYEQESNLTPPISVHNVNGFSSNTRMQQFQERGTTSFGKPHSVYGAPYQHADKVQIRANN